MKNLPEKKSVVLLLFLSIITAGIYVPVWYLKRTKELNNLNTEKKLSVGLAKTYLILHILYLISAIVIQIMMKGAIMTMDLVALASFTIFLGLLSLVGLIQFIIMLILAFSTRTVLNQALDKKGVTRKISGLFTFFFNFAYLQYEINRIIDDRENEKRVGPWIWFILLIITPIIIYIIFAILMVMGIAPALI